MSGVMQGKPAMSDAHREYAVALRCGLCQGPVEARPAYCRYKCVNPGCGLAVRYEGASLVTSLRRYLGILPAAPAVLRETEAAPGD